MTEDHKEIWLECKCGDFSYEGRQWCEDDVFECSDHGPDCAGPVKYVRADLHETLRAENERLRNVLSQIALYTDKPECFEVADMALAALGEK
jgi:hypothetical protein